MTIDPAELGGIPVMFVFNWDNKLGTFTGDTLAATLTTTETEFSKGTRARLTSVRPLVDGAEPSVMVGTRNRQGDAVSYSDPVGINIYGECPVRADARYHRIRLDISGGQIWSHAEGVEVDVAASSRR